RREKQIRVQRADVLRFLFQAQGFPRSLLFSINAVESAVEHLTNHENIQLVIHRIKRQLDNAQIDKLKQNDLRQIIDHSQVVFAQAHTELQQNYFSGLGATQTQAQTAA